MESAIKKNIAALQLEAENAFRAGRMPEVSRLSQQILKVDDKHLQAMHLLRLAANASGDTEQELPILRRILADHPDHVESLNGLADALRKQGNPGSGIELCIHAIQLRPNYANAYNTLGLCYFETGKLPEAAEAFERAVAYLPTLAAACVNLGAIYQRLDRKAEAARWYRRAIELNPNSSEAQEALGMLLVQQRRPFEAVNCFRQVLRMNPNSDRAHLLLADALQQQGSSEKANEVVRKALAMNPTSSTGHCMLGFVRMDLGDFERARASFERSISIQPAQAEAYLGLAISKKISEEDRPLVNRMLALLEDKQLSEVDLAQMHNALGKAFDDLKDYEKAIGHVDEGNRIALASGEGGRPPGSKEAEEAYVRKTIETFTPEFYRKHAGEGLDSELPIFIIGPPRSGTTLLEQILSSHSEVVAGGEIRYWDEVAGKNSGRLIGLAGNRPGMRTAAQEYVRQIDRIGPRARFIIDKYNDNFFNAGFLHHALPRARIIHSKRNPVDNCISMYMTPFRRKDRMFRKRETILDYYREYERLVAHWREVLPPETFLEVDYEEVVANREKLTREIIAFCGLQWEDSCLKHEENTRIVNTPSKWQARQPIYTTSVERWRRYEPWLGAFRELLG